MIEVEIKARIKDIESVRKKVIEAGAIFMKKEDQMDCIFGHPLMLDENKMVVEGGYMGRVRQVNGKVKLTFKEIVRGKSGIEIETEIGNVEIGKSFLTRLGFEEAFMVHKIRDVFELSGVEIAVDKVKILGDFIEVEKIVDVPEKVDSAHADCQKVLDSLGIEYEIITKKYGDLMQEIINQGKK
jgi:adenylate cyclase class 2